MKIGWKIRKLWHFEVSQIFTKHLILTSRYKLCKWATWWCHPLTTWHIILFCTYNFGKINILPKRVIVCPSYQAILMLTLSYIYSEMNWGKSTVIIAEIWNFCNSVYKMNGKLWGDDIFNSLICIFISTGQEIFSWKFAKLQSVKTSLFFNRFSSGFHCYIYTFLLFLLKLSWICFGFPL